MLLVAITDFLALLTELPILPPIFTALFLLTIFLDLCVLVFLLAIDVPALPTLVAILLLFEVVALLLLLTLIFVFLIAFCCVRTLVFVLRTVDLETVGLTLELLTETLGRLVTLCVLICVDTGALIFADLFVPTVLLVVLLILFCGCIVVLFDLTLLMLMFDCFADLFDVTLLLPILDCLVTCVGFELIDELLLAGREELTAFVCEELLCPWLLFCEELLLPLDFPFSFAKVFSAKTNVTSNIIIEMYLNIFVFFLANIIILLSLIFFSNLNLYFF